MSHHPEPLEGIGLCRLDAAFLPGNIDLLLHRIHTLQIRQQQSPPLSAADDDTVLLGIQLSGGIHPFGLSQHIHAVLQFIQFADLNRREAGIPCTGGDGVFHDLPGHIHLSGGNGSDAAPQPAADVQ